MQIECQLSKEDYHLFLKRLYFEKNAGIRLFLLSIFSLLIGVSKEAGHPFELPVIILKTLASATIFFCLGALIPFFIAKIKLRKALVTKPIIGLRTFNIWENGVGVTSPNEDSFWRWETLKSADMVSGFLYFTLFTNKYYLIPINSFLSENEAINFLGLLRNNISKVSGKSVDRKVHNLYYWGLIGFIPNFGLVVGVILTVKGFNYKDPKLIAIGVACILFTIFFWTIILPFIITSGYR